MGKIIGKVTDAVGLTNNKAEEKAAKAAGYANAQAMQLSKESIALQKEELAFTKQQYQDWKDIYGDIQENLGDYYKTLGSDKITAMGLENQQREFQAASTAVNEEFAQRGISNSGIAAVTNANAKFQNAEARARIRTDADQKVADAKLGFLGVGLGQGASLLGAVGNSASNVNNAYGTAIQSRTSATNNYLGQQTSLSNTNSNTMGDLFGVGAGFLKT